MADTWTSAMLDTNTDEYRWTSGAELDVSLSLWARNQPSSNADCVFMWYAKDYYLGDATCIQNKAVLCELYL